MKKGFTLVELLIVMAVIAALMAVATPMAMNAVRTAKASQIAQNLSALTSAVEQYVYTEKKVPRSINDLKDYLTIFDTIKKTYILRYNKPTDSSDLFDNTGKATIVIVYNGKDVTPTAVANQYTLAGTITTTSIYADGDSAYSGFADKYLPGATVTVMKWW